MSSRTDVGEAIRRLRLDHGWTQVDLAKKVSISVPAISKLESGRTDINLARLEQIARLFDFSSAELVFYSRIDVINPKTSVEIETRIRECDQEIYSLQREVISLLQQLTDLGQTNSTSAVQTNLSNILNV